MTNTKDIQELVCKEEVIKGNLPCENIQVAFIQGEQDVLSILKSGYVAEYEVKVSRSDFKADAKKSKWKSYALKIERHMPNYFSYVCPPGMIKEYEVQSFAGLIYAHDNHLEVIKKAKILHRFKHDITGMLKKFARVKSERKYLGSCLMTYQNNQIKERRKELLEKHKAL